MRLIEVAPDELHVSADLLRSGSSKSFEERLRYSLEEIGLVEPLKVAVRPSGGYLVIDGALRLRAIHAIRREDQSRFQKVGVYVLDYDRRYEIRYQSDIYQDLLPSQLATLVEHLHRTEGILKADIARYIGVSPATLRNYTGLWRLMERGGLFARIVQLMDLGVLPASNPYAWLRLTDEGLNRVICESFAEGSDADSWISKTAHAARLGRLDRYPLKYIEAVTTNLPADCFRVGEDVRAIKRHLGLRRGSHPAGRLNLTAARTHLTRVSNDSKEPVLASAARSLQEYLI